MTSSKYGPSSNTTIFVSMLALGILVHKTQAWNHLSAPLPMLTTGLSAALLFKPDAPRMVLALAVATLAEALWYSPFYLLAHMVYVVFICLAILGAAGVLYAKEKRLPLAVGELEPYLFPLLRAGLYAMFAIVVLHKTNLGFLNHQGGSCAIEHYEMLQARVPFLPDPVAGIPIFTLLTEASIPILLFFHRTRQLGFLVAFGFHYVMAINGFQGFSGFAMAIYMPFVSPGFHRDVAEFLSTVRGRPFGALVLRVLPIGFAVLAVAMTAVEAIGRTFQLVRLGQFLYLVLAPPLTALYFWLVFRKEALPQRWPSGRATAAWQVALLALFVANGLSPYFGLKTEAVMAIFSNLGTEEGRWNHAFLPEALRIAKFQDAPVTVTSVSGMTLLDPWERDYLPSRVGEGTVFVVTQFELKRQIAAHCRAGQGPIPLSYRTMDGKQVELADACADPALSAGNGWLLEKLLWFRPVHDSANPCLH